MLILALIKEQMGRASVVRDHDIDAPIVVKVAESSASRRPGVTERFSRFGRHVGKFAACIFQEQRSFQVVQVGLCDFDVVHDVACGHEYLMASVVISVKGMNAPAAVRT